MLREGGLSGIKPCSGHPAHRQGTSGSGGDSGAVWVSSAWGAQGEPLWDPCPSSSLNAPGNPGPGRTQEQLWLQPRPGSGSGEDAGQRLPQENISRKGRGNRWSQEAAVQTGLLPGCRWQSHPKHGPGLFQPFCPGTAPCACPRCLPGPRQPLGCPCLEPSDPPGASPVAVGTSEVGAAETGLRGWGLGCSPKAGVLPAALPGIPAEPAQPRGGPACLTQGDDSSPQLPRGQRRGVGRGEEGPVEHKPEGRLAAGSALVAALAAPQKSTGQRHRVPAPSAWSRHGTCCKKPLCCVLWAWYYGGVHTRESG